MIINIIRKYSVKRLNFNKLTSENIAYFKSILDETSIITNEEELTQNNTDWIGKYRGNSKLLLKPKSTKEVSDILKYCNQFKYLYFYLFSLAIVPQGGNTGLVGIVNFIYKVVACQFLMK